jgi:hypothetical protein
MIGPGVMRKYHRNDDQRVEDNRHARMDAFHDNPFDNESRAGTASPPRLFFP